MTAKRIYLSPPNVDNVDLEHVRLALEGGWVAPAGPNLSVFERDLEKLTPGKKVLVLNSGTSALHLALLLAGVEKGDEVVVGTFTFAACGNVVRYQQAVPVFLDSEDETWNLDPALLHQYLTSAKKLPRAVIVTHLYGVPAKIDEIKEVCDKYEVDLIEDAAEAFGSTHQSRQVGTIGTRGIISFNGNKIITTSGGGALMGSEQDYANALYLSTQANSGEFGYEHLEVGYNYRMSNVLASLGIAQLGKLDQFVSKKRAVAAYYQRNLNPEIFEFPKELTGTFSNKWLTTPLIREEFKDKLEPLDLIKFLDRNGVEARLLWKPLHMHPVNRDCKFFGGNVAEKIFGRGLCLPSGTKMSENELGRVVSLIEGFLKSV